MKRILILVVNLALISIVTVQGQNQTSFVPGKVWKDNKGVHINAHGGGILFQKGTYYWYGEHKIEGDAGNYAQVGVHCYSSKDLYNWKDEGIALSVDSANSESAIAKGCIIERPKVIYNKKTRKYVMWFHLELKGKGYGAAHAAVAISSKISGPYRFLHSFRTNANRWPINVTSKDSMSVAGGDATLKSLPFVERGESGYLLRRDFKSGQMARDMSIFQDDNNKAYLISSAEDNLTLNISELSDDYTTLTGKWFRLFPGKHNEGPAMFKKDGKYYLITSGCTGWNPNAARSAVAPSIWGPWTELGNPCVGNDSNLTFHSQSTFVLPVQGKKNVFIFMADRWTPKNAIDGGYVWLPILWKGDKPTIKWFDTWTLNSFNKNSLAF